MRGWSSIAGIEELGVCRFPRRFRPSVRVDGESSSRVPAIVASLWVGGAIGGAISALAAANSRSRSTVVSSPSCKGSSFSGNLGCQGGSSNVLRGSGTQLRGTRPGVGRHLGGGGGTRSSGGQGQDMLLLLVIVIAGRRRRARVGGERYGGGGEATAGLGRGSDGGLRRRLGGDEALDGEAIVGGSGSGSREGSGGGRVGANALGRGVKGRGRSRGVVDVVDGRRIDGAHSDVLTRCTGARGPGARLFTGWRA